MRKFFSNRRLVLIVVALLVAFGLMGGSVVVRNKRSTPPIIQQFGNDVVGITGSVVTYPVNWVRNGTTAVKDLLNTYSENRELKKQVSEMTELKVRNKTLSKENKELKKELKVNKTLTDYSTVSASVLSRSPSSWQKQLVISKGSSSGIKKNMPVLSNGSLIGRVSEVNKTNSKVELLTNTSSSSNGFAIQIEGTNNKTVNGTITGYDSKDNLLVMGEVSSSAKLKKGTKVTTSGLGGVTPKGLYVGKVAKVTSDDYGLAKKVYIKPAADFNNLDIVTVAETTN